MYETVRDAPKKAFYSIVYVRSEKSGGVIMQKIFIDAGHGGTDPGASGNGLVEKDLTLAISQMIATYVQSNFSGVEVMFSRKADQTVSLTERTRAANMWGADLLLSIHINAGGGRGFESYVYNGSFKGKADTRAIQRILHTEIISETGFRDRGMKEQNFHMVRASNCPALLTENGFIDHMHDAKWLRSPSFLEKIAVAHGNGVARILALKKKTVSEKKVMYRVVAGSFENYAYAKERARVLEERGFDSFIEPFSARGTTYYRVIIGSFRKLANAKRRSQTLEKRGFDNFVTH